MSVEALPDKNAKTANAQAASTDPVKKDGLELVDQDPSRTRVANDHNLI